MEVLLHFEGSRRVVAVPAGSTLEVELEKEVVKCFPDRDIAIASIGGKVPQSSSKEVYLVQKLAPKWGYVDVTDSSQVQGGDEVTLAMISKLKEVTHHCQPPTHPVLLLPSTSSPLFLYDVPPH